MWLLLMLFCFAKLQADSSQSSPSPLGAMQRRSVCSSKASFHANAIQRSASVFHYYSFECGYE